MLWGIAALLIPALLWPQAAFWLPLTGVLAAVVLFDAVVALRNSRVTGTRSVPPHVPVNRSTRVTIELHNTSSRRLRLLVEDETPTHTKHTTSHRARLQLGADEVAGYTYELIPQRRGDAAFGAIAVMVSSPLLLWQLRRRIADPTVLRVYPDFAAITDYLALLSDQQSQRIGLRLLPRRGEGMEFHQLRDYQDGDSPRHVDWKATARRGQLTSREYTEERDQRVVFLIDTGGRMRARDHGISHFDYALNAMLLMAYVALRQGDTVAIRTFGPTQRWLPELRGTSAINHILNELYDVHSQAAASDFQGGAQALMDVQRKRSMVVVLTSLREEDQDLLPALELLRERHLVVLANLRESIVDAEERLPVQDFDSALRYVGIARFLRVRARSQRYYANTVHGLIDCVPEQLRMEMLNHYWAIKRSGAL